MVFDRGDRGNGGEWCAAELTGAGATVENEERLGQVHGCEDEAAFVEALDNLMLQLQPGSMLWDEAPGI